MNNEAKTVRVREARSFEVYSRGPELVRAIRRTWKRNNALPACSNAEIEESIRWLYDNFDLNVAEWYYWSHLANSTKTGD